MKKRFLFYIFIFLITLFIGVSYGYFIHKNEVFPYRVVKNTYNQFVSNKEELVDSINIYGPWSVGIYEGSTPFNLSDPVDISNPVLTGKDVLDRNTGFVADPFMILKDETYYMFCEVAERENYHGDIGYAVSMDGKKWEYKNIVIDEPFHLSYPYVFEFNDEYYIIPESNEDLSVRLYKAASFPDKWEYMGNILNGYPYVDPSIFQYNNKWWLFVSIPSNDVLNLYYSDDLLGPWKPHSMNPIIKNDKNIARPGGRVISFNDKLYRMAQDDYPYYSLQVYAFEITELSDNRYTEQKVETPIVTLSGTGWNERGMHHVDLHKIGDKWVAAVDGFK